MPTESMQHVMTRLNEEGFTDQCRAGDSGIHFCKGREEYAPEDVHVQEVVRLEGTSAPDEQVMVFAIASPDRRIMGTYCVAHGPDMDALDVDMMQRLVVPSEDEAQGHYTQEFQPQY